MDEETYCRFMLSELQKAYIKDAKPYIDRLVAIEAMKPPRIIVPMGHLNNCVELQAAASQEGK